MELTYKIILIGAILIVSFLLLIFAALYIYSLIKFRNVFCGHCKTKPPIIRRPVHAYQKREGGWKCKKCSKYMDVRGKIIEDPDEYEKAWLKENYGHLLYNEDEQSTPNKHSQRTNIAPLLFVHGFQPLLHKNPLHNICPCYGRYA